MGKRNCFNCGQKLTWRNNPYRCKDCGREFCKECASYKMGGIRMCCPNCGSGKLQSA